MITALSNFFMNNFLVCVLSLYTILIIYLLALYRYQKEVNDLYIKYKEIIHYIIVGVLTTFVSIGSYWLFRQLMISYLISSVLSWIAAVIFAFFANRLFVFYSDERNIVKELSAFISVRLLTLFIEIAFMFIAVDLFKSDDMIAKIVGQVIILILNYIFSKLIVFKKTKKE